MEITLKEIKTNWSRNNWVDVVPIGDIHLGNKGCNISKLKKIIKYVKEHKHCYWIGMGDYIDCINYTDKRFDPSTITEPFISNLTNSIPLQVEELLKLLSPIKDKCLGLLRGNHEEKIRLKYQYDILYDMTKAWDFKVPNLKDTAIIRLRFTAVRGIASFDIFCTHSNVGGRKGGAKLNRLEDMIGHIDADIYLMAHAHIKLTASRSVLFVDQRLNLTHKKRVMAVTGSFFNGYAQDVPSYIEKMGYPPTSTGSVKLMINPRRHDVHISE